jgi:hypothetical protein
MQPQDRARLAEIFKTDPQHPDVRVAKCIAAFQSALEEFGCEVQVSIHFANGTTTPEVRIVPVNRVAPPIFKNP